MAKHSLQMYMGVSEELAGSKPPASRGEHVSAPSLRTGKLMVVFIFLVMKHIAENYIWGIL